MERKDEDATRERRRLFHRALWSLLGSIEAAAAARACRAPVLTFGFYDLLPVRTPNPALSPTFISFSFQFQFQFRCLCKRFISAVFDAKGADAILSFEKFCCNLPRPLLQVPVSIWITFLNSILIHLLINWVD
ncbi:hypothetical protein S245_065792 [Arachis hypogaea]